MVLVWMYRNKMLLNNKLVFLYIVSLFQMFGNPVWTSITLKSQPISYVLYLPCFQEASKLRNDESLRKCPKCSSPARCINSVQDRAFCSKCQHDFCIKCLRCYHGATDCSIVMRKKPKVDTSVGTKKSKTNLRRLWHPVNVCIVTM